MKLIKYFTSFLLFSIIFVFVGEIYVWSLENFQTEFKYVTFYLQKDTTKSEMQIDIYEAAEKENIQVFVVDRTINSLFSETINIYGTSSDLEYYLSKKCNINSGNYDSIFLGNINVEFFDWMDIQDIEKFETYYTIGNDEDIINFKKNLVDKYGGRFPKEGYQAINSKFSISIVWTCVISFLLLLTFYEVALQKKSIIVRVTIGEKISQFILKNIIYDGVINLIIFFGLMKILSYYTNTLYLKEFTILSFGIFLVLNSFVYFWLFFTDLKKDIQTQKSAKMILRVSYLYKIITSIMLIITMTGCIELIFDGISCYRQKNFFETHKNYNYITVGGNGLDDAKKMLNEYYSKGSEKGKKISLVDLGKWSTDAEYILADHGALDYLYTVVPEVEGKITEKKLYYLVPEDCYNQNVFDDMQSINYSYYEREYEYEIIEYKNTSWVMAISNEGKVRSTLKRNPVIILNNLDSMVMPESSILYVGNSTMYCFSNMEFKNIALKSSYKGFYYQTNVYENYIYFWNVMKRNMLMGIVFLFILLLLEGLILKSILKYEYQINAKELLLSKIQGRSFFYRQRKVLIILLGEWLCLLISIIICLVLDFFATGYVMAGGILVMLLEHIFTFVYSNKLENVNISKIFKGGLL